MADVADGLKPANENPWYVLMTLYGEQEGEEIDWNLHEKNRRAWNAWIVIHFLQSEMDDLARYCHSIWLEVQEYLARHSDNSEVRIHITELYKIRLNNRIFPLPEPSNLDFSNMILPDGISFDKHIFPNQTNFEEARLKDVSFQRAFFLGEVNFAGSRFEGETSLDDCVFLDNVDFSGSDFQSISMCGSQFFARFQMENCRVSGKARFSHSYFRFHAYFEATQFSGRTSFQGMKMNSLSSFMETIFLEPVIFMSVDFGTSETSTTASPNFTRCDFRAGADFRGSQFLKGYPVFETAKFNGKMSFSAEPGHWKTHPSQHAGTAKATCSVIRNELAKQGLPEDEHFFFRREMYFAGRSDNFWRNLPYRFFGLVSDYGHSILRPCLFLLGLWIIPALIYLWTMSWASVMSGSFAVSLRAFGFSFANIFKFLGFQKTYFVKEFDTLNPWLDFLSAGQTVFGFVFLFFLGLGLRQRFRLR